MPHLCNPQSFVSRRTWALCGVCVSPGRLLPRGVACTPSHAPRLRFTKTRAQAAASLTARKQETTENWDKERMAQNLQITCELREHCVCCLQDLVGQSRVLLMTLKESEGTRALSKTRFISFSRRLATAEPWLGGSQQRI